MTLKEQITRLAEANVAYGNIISRTSIRQYSAKPVDSETIDALLYAAISAPTAVNSQPWEFIVVTDKEKLRQMAERLPYAKMTAHAPVAFALCGNEERFLKGDDSTLWVQDLSATSENLLLAANALGLGGVWTCLYPHADRMEAVSEILDLPSGIVPFNLIPVGYPENPGKPKEKWNPERIHNNGY